MEHLYHIFLVGHIVGGTISLLSGAFGLLFAKGDKTHRVIGIVFVYSMFLTGFSALILSLINANYFLFVVGIFSLYMTGTAYRFALRRKTPLNNRPGLQDWLWTISMMLAGAAFIVKGIMDLVRGDSFGIVSVVFGAIGLLFTRNDILTYRSSAPLKWWLPHLQRMTGGYIASATAFLVVNSNNMIQGIPSFVYWLFPTLVLTPLIVYWSRKYRTAPPYKRIKQAH